MRTIRQTFTSKQVPTTLLALLIDDPLQGVLLLKILLSDAQPQLRGIPNKMYEKYSASMTSVSQPRLWKYFHEARRNLSSTQVTYSHLSYGFRDPADMDIEAKSNQGGVAAHKAYIQDRMELIPYNNTGFGRGKERDHEGDIIQFLNPGFLPSRDQNTFATLPRPVQRAIEWREYIERKRLSHDFSID